MTTTKRGKYLLFYSLFYSLNYMNKTSVYDSNSYWISINVEIRVWYLCQISFNAVGPSFDFIDPDL